VFAHQRVRLQVLFACADAILTLLAFEASYQLRLQAPFGHLFFLHREAHWLMASLSALTVAGLGLREQAYQSANRTALPVLLRKTLRQCGLGLTALILAQYVVHLAVPLSRTFLVLFGTCDFFVLFAFRLAAPHSVRLFQRQLGQPYNVVLVGSRERVDRLRDEICRSTPFQTRVIASLDVESCDDGVAHLLQTQVIDEIIFAVPIRQLGALQRVLARCDEQGIQARIALQLPGQWNSKIRLDKVGETSLLTFTSTPADELRLMVKRMLDITVSAAAIVLLAPAMAAVALAVKWSSPGPVLFRQTRCGLNGKPFTLYKFRSMVANADALKRDLEHLSERQIAFKLTADPRITPLGRTLRRYSIDEWPQFYNVLRGDMALVGPRPPLPDEVARYEGWQKRRLRMRPGLTCLWALMGRDRLDFQSWMRADLSYIDHWSLRLDWLILLRTIPQVLTGKGAH
jgi:exopolysaccharide biosynthesis polyprenyl glycosylphosphotransferase